ncbi:putative E3 ubiquitin-protein ligase LIN-1 isoform X2 [Asparagus officinalis]|nr:putative E3 ubiquitin-protein ligase LIN-1 isoform X2 [Asparagus officinalis]
MVTTLENQDNVKREKTKVPAPSPEEYENSAEPRDGKALLTYLDEEFDPEINESFDIRCLQDMLEDSQSDSQTDSEDSEAKVHQEKEIAAKALQENEDILTSNIGERKYLPENTVSDTSRWPMQAQNCKANTSCLLPSRSYSTVSNLNFSILDLKGMESNASSRYYIEEEISPGKPSTHEIRCFRSFSSKFRKKHSLHELVHHGNFARKRINVSSNDKDWSDESSTYEKESQIELLGKFEKAVSSLCITDGTGCGTDGDLEVRTLWELLNNKTEVKYSSVKQEIFDQLMTMISTSRKEKVIRASVSIMSVLISEDKTIVEGIKRKDLHLYYLASALKKNVHEAAIVIYMLNPSPSEIKSLELLPALVEVACNSNSQKKESISLPLTPTAASIAMIEILVTSFDYVTNNIHLAAISSPKILSKFVNVAMNKNLEEGTALTAIFVRCMRLNGNCKKFLSQITPVDPFLHLLRSNESRAKSAALEYFHEILRIPRSSAIHLLHRIRQQGGASIMHTLMNCVQQAELKHRILAANLLFHLDILVGSNSKRRFREEAMQVLLETVTCEDNSNAQLLSALILSNVGGTYSWTGESYTAAWLAKKTGLTSAHHKNMFRNIDWFDPCLQDSEICAWSSKVARAVIKFGTSVFNSLGKGIRSNTKSVQRECLIAIAWLGNEMALIGQSNLRYSACEILLNEVASFLHPGSELEERVLACLCVYNYTSGKAKQKLLNFSEGLRESLRRLSGVTWMAEELLNVTEFFLPNQPRVSCVHTQSLEIGQSGNGAVTALIFYKGQLHAGYSDGSIKVWDIKGQRTILVWEVKEHKRPVTCFALSNQGDSLLSGSVDKTIRVWKMMNKKLECVEVIHMKESIQKVASYGEKIFVVTQSKGLKVWDSSRRIQIICKNKHVKSLDVAQGKVYIGFTDSSMQEVDITEDHKIEIRAPENSWRRKNKPINSTIVYKGWLYCAGAVVEGSSIKEWRRHRKPRFSITMSRGTKVRAMAVVEDFIYLNCSSSPSIIQIWLREHQQKLGRLSVGSKITSLLTANDIVLCGSEAGLIKGWIPL